MQIYLIGQTHWVRDADGKNHPTYTPVAVFATRDEACRWIEKYLSGETFLTTMELSG